MTKLLPSKNLQRFARYIAAGGLNFGCEYLVFLAFYYGLHLPLVAANTITFGFSLTLSFLLSRNWVFATGSDNHATRQLWQFTTLAIFNLIVTNVLLVVLKNHGVEPAVAKLSVMSLIVIWNFAVLRNLIFRTR
jgi:putative flippase GtrA